MSRLSLIFLAALILVLPLSAQVVAVPLQWSSAWPPSLAYHAVDGYSTLQFQATPPAAGQIIAAVALVGGDGMPLMETITPFWMQSMVGGESYELQVLLSPLLAGLDFAVHAVFLDVDGLVHSSDVHQISVGYGAPPVS
jgi:hypothetical protein